MHLHCRRYEQDGRRSGKGEGFEDDTVRSASPRYYGASGVVSHRTNLVSFIFLPRYHSHPTPFLPDSLFIGCLFVDYCLVPMHARMLNIELL